MAISTASMVDGANLLSTLLVDEVQIYNVASKPTTNGYVATRALTAVGGPIPALVQTTTLANAVESMVENLYSVKVAVSQPITAGQAVKVTRCTREPSLVGKTLLLDKISQNGLALIRKAVARDFDYVNGEGKP